MNGHTVGSYVAADPTGATAAGLNAAAAMNADLIAEDTRHAVAAYRARPEVAEQFWDARYAGEHRIWSGNPNPVLVRETAQLTPSTALDLGCGEGADAVWLAQQDWQVTGVDISQVALDRATEHASDAGVADRIDWQRRDLGESFPTGSFDLVSAQSCTPTSTFPATPSCGRPPPR